MFEEFDVQFEQEELEVDTDLFDIEREVEDGEGGLRLFLRKNKETAEWEVLNPPSKDEAEEQEDSDEDWTEVEEREGENVVSETVTMPRSMVADLDLLRNVTDPKELQQLQYQMAPGEGNRPLSLYMDNGVLTLAFPTVFAGEDVNLPKRISFCEYAKWLMMHVNPVARLNLDLIFMSMKRQQLETAISHINIAFKKMKGNKNGGGVPSVRELLAGTFLQDSVFKVRDAI